MDNNNEQEIFLRQKIEKREKVDTIIAYVLIVILLGAIVLITILKINDKEDVLVPPVDEYTPTYISLGEISTSLNNSNLANSYINDGATFTSSATDNAINVTYTKDDINLNLNMSMVGSELMVNVPSENSDIATDIYKEVATTICVYYGNQDEYCRYTLDNMDSYGLDGIRFDNSNVYITTTKSFPVANEIVYKNVTIVDVNESDYILELNDTRISNINISNTTDYTITGNISRLKDDRSTLSVVVKLYDNANNLLGENKYEFNENNALEDSSTFSINFILNDTLKLENIRKYSIEITK